jgi:hypothetical protein
VRVTHQESKARPIIVPVTSVIDGTDHAVDIDAMAAGILAGHGRYIAVCGIVIEPAAMSAPPMRQCLACQAALHAPQHSKHERSSKRRCRAGRRRRSRAPGWAWPWAAIAAGWAAQALPDATGTGGEM